MCFKWCSSHLFMRTITLWDIHKTVELYLKEWRFCAIIPVAPDWRTSACDIFHKTNFKVIKVWGISSWLNSCPLFATFGASSVQSEATFRLQRSSHHAPWRPLASSLAHPPLLKHKCALWPGYESPPEVLPLLLSLWQNLSCLYFHVFLWRCISTNYRLSCRFISSNIHSLWTAWTECKMRMLWNEKSKLQLRFSVRLSIIITVNGHLRHSLSVGFECNFHDGP